MCLFFLSLFSSATSMGAPSILVDGAKVESGTNLLAVESGGEGGSTLGRGLKFEET